MPLVYNTPGLYSSSSHVHSTGAITSGIFDPARLGSGTATATTFLRGDGVWATVTLGGGGAAWDFDEGSSSMSYTFGAIDLDEGDSISL
jgi:hypothetical protein